MASELTPTRENINLPIDGKGNTWLHKLCAENKPASMIEHAIRRGADINALNKEGMPPLALALQYAQPDRARALLDHGALVFFKLPDGRAFNGVSIATYVDKRYMFDVLLEYGGGFFVNEPGMDPDGKQSGMTPLHVAAHRSRDTLIEPLIAAGAFPDLGYGYDDTTALHIAAREANAEIIDKLYRGGAKIDRKDKLGRTPLHLAATGNRQYPAERLLELGADINATDSNGATPLIAASHNSSIMFLRVLLKYKPDLDRATIAGTTALMNAAGRTDMDMVNLLLKEGADPCLTDAFNRSAAVYASEGPYYNYSQKNAIEKKLRDAEQEIEQARFEAGYKKLRP